MSRKTNLRDIAELAKVSVGTVSRVLNNQEGASNETRARVLEAAEKLNYQIKLPVSLPLGHVVNTIGLIVKRDSWQQTIDNFYVHVLMGVEHECQRRNITLMYANMEVDRSKRPLSLPTMLLEGQADAFLIVGAFLDATAHQIHGQGKPPIVLVDGYTHDHSFDSVVTDNFNGAYDAVRFLIAQGHRRIGMIGGTAHSYPSIRDRRQGYLQALADHGISEVFIEDCDLIRADGYEAAIRLCKHPNRVTALFVCNDELAVGVLNAARDIGLRVPDDISVMGFDDMDLGQAISPALTTVNVDKLLMGSLGVRMILDRAENMERRALTTVISTRLTVRDSVAPPRNRS